MREQTARVERNPPGGLFFVCEKPPYGAADFRVLFICYLYTGLRCFSFGAAAVRAEEIGQSPKGALAAGRIAWKKGGGGHHAAPVQKNPFSIKIILSIDR
jgi:hypothetical protein